MLAAYDPATDGVVVMLTLDIIYPLHVSSKGETRSPGRVARTPLKQQSSLELPAGVSFSRTMNADGGVTYNFNHQQLGPLGQVIIADSGSGYGQAQFRMDVPRGDPNDPLYMKRLALFQPIAQRMQQALDDNYPGPAADDAMGLDTMAETMKLYSAFTAVQSSFEMQLLLERLSADEIETILGLAEQTIPAASWTDARAIRQRIEDLKQLQRNPLPISPVVRGLHQFIQAKTDRAARHILLAQSDLLLTPEAAQELAEFMSDDPVSREHLKKRRRLFKRLRQRQGK